MEGERQKIREEGELQKIREDLEWQEKMRENGMRVLCHAPSTTILTLKSTALFRILFIDVGAVRDAIASKHVRNATVRLAHKPEFALG